MATEIREECATAFDYACKLTRLPNATLRLRLTEELNQGALEPRPTISHTALLEWRRGDLPVDAEVLMAACRLSGATATFRPDGSVHVEIDVPAASYGGLRPLASQRVSASLAVVAGGLAAFGLLYILFWPGEVSWPQVVHTFQNVAHVVTSAPVSNPMVASLLPSASPLAQRSRPFPQAGAGSDPSRGVGAGPASSPRPSAPLPGQTSGGQVAVSSPQPASSSPPPAPSAVPPAVAAAPSPAPPQLPFGFVPPAPPPVKTAVDPLPSPPPPSPVPVLPSPSLP